MSDHDDRPDAAAPAAPDPLPLSASEEDPSAEATAALPGYAAGGAGDGDAAVGPPSQDPSATT